MRRRPTVERAYLAAMVAASLAIVVSTLVRLCGG